MNKKLLLVAGILSSLTLAGQNLRFDVASIKPHVRVAGAPVVPQTLRAEPTKLSYANASLMAVIQAAYGIPGEGRPDYHLTGGPDWLTTVRFDIEAATDHAVSKDQMMLMLQSLPAERFKLKAHRETRDLRVYALTAAKNGPKVARAKDGERETLPQANTVWVISLLKSRHGILPFQSEPCKPHRSFDPEWKFPQSAPLYPNRKTIRAEGRRPSPPGNREPRPFHPMLAVAACCLSSFLPLRRALAP